MTAPMKTGARSGTRTHTSLRSTDFKSVAYANSAIRACAGSFSKTVDVASKSWRRDTPPARSVQVDKKGEKFFHRHNKSFFRSESLIVRRGF